MTSGWAWMSWLTSTSTSASSSMRAFMRSLSSAASIGRVCPASMSEDQLAELAALLQPLQGGGVVVEAEHLVHHDGEAPGHEPRDLGPLLVGAHGRPDDLVLLEEQPGQVQLHGRARRAAADHQAPARHE